MNASMSKDVIYTVFKKLAGKHIRKLPSSGTISHISLEAWQLANVEVALSISKSTPEDALGNCIHGDGTTRFHTKWQNFQVTWPDGTFRIMGLTEMASSDTDAVFSALTDKIKGLGRKEYNDRSGTHNVPVQQETTIHTGNFDTNYS